MPTGSSCRAGKGAAIKWSSENATLGKLHGTFSVIGSSILSVYRSESAGYHGADHLRRLDDDNYESTGMLLLEDRLSLALLPGRCFSDVNSRQIVIDSSAAKSHIR